MTLTDRGRELLESHRTREHEPAQTFLCRPRQKPRTRARRPALSRLPAERRTAAARRRAHPSRRPRLRAEARVPAVPPGAESRSVRQRWPTRSDARGDPGWAHEHDLPVGRGRRAVSDFRIEYEWPGRPPRRGGRRGHDTPLPGRARRGEGSRRASPGIARAAARVGGADGPRRWSSRSDSGSPRSSWNDLGGARRAVAAHGLHRAQAGFLVTVMLHAGVCLGGSTAPSRRIAYGQKMHDFFRSLLARGYATARGCGHNRARLYHVHHKPLYRAIGEPNNRHRRPMTLAARRRAADGARRRACRSAIEPGWRPSRTSSRTSR